MGLENFVTGNEINRTVVVTNLSLAITENEIKDFFTYCGQISKIQVDEHEGQKRAAILFMKEAAARTALLLSSAIITDSQITVSPFNLESAPPYIDPSNEEFHDAPEYSEHTEELTQESKPRSSIIVELAAKGYVMNDKITERAKEFDEEHGVSEQFKKYVETIKEKGLELNEKYKISENVQKTLVNINEKYKVSQKINEIDEKYHVKEKIGTASQAATDLAQKALKTETGQAIQGFIFNAWNTAKAINEDAKKQADEISKNKRSSINMENIPIEHQKDQQQHQ